MERDTLQLILSASAALCAAAAWHAARINAMKLDELKRSIESRWTDSVSAAGREQRAIGKLEGGKDERLDQAARLEHARDNSILVTELPSEERHADGTE